jgi:hypothetical protein
MKFSAKQDVEAPIAFVFAYLTDFDTWERSALRRGAEVARTDQMRSPGAGMSWKAAFAYRGTMRKLDIQLVKMVAPNTLQIAAKSPAIEVDTGLNLTEMSARRCRLHATLDVTPRNLAARLFMQSLRLARARMDRKFALRIAQVVAEIETAYREKIST